MDRYRDVDRSLGVNPSLCDYRHPPSIHPCYDPSPRCLDFTLQCVTSPVVPNAEQTVTAILENHVEQKTVQEAATKAGKEERVRHL